MIIRTIVGGLIAVMLVGCSTSQYRWQHATAADQQFEAEKVACKEIANKHAAEQGPSFYDDHWFFHSLGYSTRNHGSFVGFGYAFGHDPYFENQREYFEVCMKAKGWQRVKVREQAQNSSNQ